MTRHRIIVLGTLASEPYAGMAWMNMQITAGLRGMGHDAYYFETTSTWPYDPVRQTRVCDSDYAVPYLSRIARRFGLGERWAYRRSYLDKQWLGMRAARAIDLLATADAVLNVAGASRLLEEGLKVKRLVYYGTDPVYHEVLYANGDPSVREIVDEHDDVVTYGENIGNADCPIPPLPRLRTTTRPPILIDRWSGSARPRYVFTTVGNWEQHGRDILLDGRVYYWSKHREFKKFLDLPQRVDTPIELATNLNGAGSHHDRDGDVVRAIGLQRDARSLLTSHGWHVADACRLTTNPWEYRDYVTSSRGEFTVARDLNVRLRSGWFSERSACYLAAGRPVITQDTGFGTILPVGEGLFAFTTMEEIVSAFDAINADYERHSRAAREIAVEYFRAETVLSRLINDLGL
jgi:hypothetical protein